MPKITTLTTVLIVGIVIIAACVSWKNFLNTPLTFPAKTIDYTLNPGTSTLHLAHDLQKAEIIDQPYYFAFLVLWRHDLKH
ncbi:MAG: hypothetical protein V4466_08005, partial [Pseudomonadota bacterium]